MEIAAEDEFQFDLTLFLLAPFRVGIQQVVFAVVSNHFAKRFVATDVLKFDVKNGIDPVLAQQRAEAVLPAVTREDRAVVLGHLAVEIELCRPPGFYPVFELERATDEAIADLGLPDEVS